MEQTGKIIMYIGALVFAAGLLIYFAGPKLSWFGHLPGDIRVEKEGFRFYAPLASMLLVSIGISVLIWLIRKLMP